MAKGGGRETVLLVVAAFLLACAALAGPRPPSRAAVVAAAARRDPHRLPRDNTHSSAAAARPRRRVRAHARLLTADEAVRGLPDGRPVQRRARLERHGQDHARFVAGSRSASGNERSGRGGTTKFWRCVALTNELNPCAVE